MLLFLFFFLRISLPLWGLLWLYTCLGKTIIIFNIPYSFFFLVQNEHSFSNVILKCCHKAFQKLCRDSYFWLEVVNFIRIGSRHSWRPIFVFILCVTFLYLIIFLFSNKIKIINCLSLWGISWELTSRYRAFFNLKTIINALLIINWQLITSRYQAIGIPLNEWDCSCIWTGLEPVLIVIIL